MTSRMLQIRVDMYSILSRLFADHLDPKTHDPETLKEGISSTIARSTTSGFPGGERIRSTLSNLENAVNDICECSERALEVQREYAMLFLLPNGVQPYESVYLDPAGLLKGEPWRDVREFYRRIGLSTDQGEKHPEDHIAVELGFMCVATSLEEKCKTTAVSVEKQFMDEHLLLWGFELAERIIRHPSASFYRIAAELLCGWLACEAHRLEQMLKECKKPLPSSGLCDVQREISWRKMTRE